MKVYDAAMSLPRAVGIVCTIGVVTLGCAYMVMAEAPVRYVALVLV